MPNDAYSQQRLASDLAFQGRVRAALASVAFQVMEEDPATPNYDARVSYARQVINQLTFMATSVSSWLVMRPNLLGFATSYDMQMGAVVSAAGDPDIQSQLHSDWDILAGGPATNPPPPGVA